MVGGGRLVQEFGGRRRRLGGGFRLGVGVKSLVGSASAWSVKGGFLLLPATRERKKSPHSSPELENKRDCCQQHCFFTIDVFCPCLGFLLRLLTFASVFSSSTFPQFCTRVVYKCCVLRYSLAMVWLGLIIVWRSRLEGHGTFRYGTERSRGSRVGGRRVRSSCLKHLRDWFGGWGPSVPSAVVIGCGDRPTWRHLPAERRGETG